MAAIIYKDRDDCEFMAWSTDTGLFQKVSALQRTHEALIAERRATWPFTDARRDVDAALKIVRADLLRLHFKKTNGPA